MTIFALYSLQSFASIFVPTVIKRLCNAYSRRRVVGPNGVERDEWSFSLPTQPPKPRPGVAASSLAADDRFKLSEPAVVMAELGGKDDPALHGAHGLLLGRCQHFSRSMSATPSAKDQSSACVVVITTITSRLGMPGDSDRRCAS